MAKIIEKIKNFFRIINLEKERIEKEKLDAEIKYYEEKLGLYGRDNTWTYIDYQYINNKGERRNYLENLRDKVENGWRNPDIVISGDLHVTSQPYINRYHIILFFDKTKFNIPREIQLDEFNFKRLNFHTLKNFTECSKYLYDNYIPVPIDDYHRFKYDFDWTLSVNCDLIDNIYTIKNEDMEIINNKINRISKLYKL